MYHESKYLYSIELKLLRVKGNEHVKDRYRSNPLSLNG